MKSRIAAVAAALCVLSLSAEARITRLELVSKQSPTFGGLAFGEVGQYENIFYRAYGEVDPTDRRNARGMVEYSVDVHILKPITLAQRNAIADRLCEAHDDDHKEEDDDD